MLKKVSLKLTAVFALLILVPAAHATGVWSSAGNLSRAIAELFN